MSPDANRNERGQSPFVSQPVPEEGSRGTSEAVTKGQPDQEGTVPFRSAELTVRPTAIPGLLVLTLPLHGDDRGWFKENWQRAKMTALGLPDFGPVQHSIAFNTSTGVTRGFHAEPWDKLVSVATGRVFGAWVDLRAGDGFGAVVTVELGPGTAVFVPRGVGNSYQTLEDRTVYSYLVNEHWSRDSLAEYTYLNLADPSVAVDWPVPLAEATISPADVAHPQLADVRPMRPLRTVIVGANGQLGRALRALLPDAELLDLPGFDCTDAALVDAHLWRGVGTIINAAAYTAVDAAETAEGRRACWAANVQGVANLARVAAAHRATLVHVSSDYVFDGTAELHTEDEPFSPLGVYGQTKAAGDALVGQLARHYLVRTSWVIGQGRNFVATMADLAARGVSPSVVDDQFGRLTFTTDLAAGILHLVTSGAPFGTYNLTNDGPVQSWCDIARDVFALCGRDPADVTGVSTEEYARGREMAPRPRHSALDLTRIGEAGFTPAPSSVRLRDYVASLG